MPFANRGSGIALSFAKRGERESCRLNVQRRAAGEGAAVLLAGAPKVTSGQQPIASGRAHGAGCVGVSELPPLRGEPVEVRCFQLCWPTVATEAAVTKIIRENDDDVRL
jgi:hypothetical protein